MTEIWKPVKGFETRYKISNQGRLFSVLKNREKAYTINHSGYKTTQLCVDGKQTHKYIHRLVAEVFLSGQSGLKEVNHKDGNKLNNSVENLEWVTRSENLKHAFKMGLMKPRPGEDNKNHTLNEEQVKEIRNLRKNNWRVVDIAERFNITPTTVSHVCNRKTWTHIKDEKSSCSQHLRDPGYKNNTSGYRGVVFDKPTNKWKVSIQFDKKKKFIGSFIDKEEAAIAYNNAALTYHGNNAKLNIIKGDNDENK